MCVCVCVDMKGDAFIKGAEQQRLSTAVRKLITWAPTDTRTLTQTPVKKQR